MKKMFLLTFLIVVISIAQVATPSQAETSDGYLMAHFTGESAMGEQVYFSTSSDGLHWTDLNNSQPVLISNVGEKGVRDPSLIRSVDGSKFWILATDLRIASGKGWDTAMHNGSTSLVIWESSDLVNWSQPWLADLAGSIPDAGCAWAPEAIYDQENENYVVYWATISPVDGIDKPRIYYATTKDFRNFSSPQIYINRPAKQGIIDTQIIKVEKSDYPYYRASGDGQITFEGSNFILGRWTTIGDISHLGLTGSDVEGPIIYKFNNVDKWGLMVDRYSSGGGYLPLVSDDLSDTGNFEKLSSSEYSLGASRKRHGSILNITAAELNALKERWTSDSVLSIQTHDKTHDVRHYAFNVRIDTVVEPLADSQWRIVPGLADPNGYISVMSVNYPGYYLRYTEDFNLRIDPADGSDAFAAAATFKEVPGLANENAVSFQAYRHPHRYIRHRDGNVRLDPVSSDSEKQDATFIITQPNAQDQHAVQHLTVSGNPIFTHKYTADPAALVDGGTLWLYTGHDFAGGQRGYRMKDWLVFSTTDMQHWTEYPVPLKITDFSWAQSGDAYAGHVAKKNGKYYWYISTNWSGIGVAVSDRPQGPFKDARGKPLLTKKDCFASSHSWACIDPAIFTDDDGQSWIFWGNRECYYAKLKDNMIEIEGSIKQLTFEGFNFTEAPWIHKHKGNYYLTYATGFPEKIAYAMADSIDGPYEYKGILNEIAGNSNTNHQAIVEFNDQWYFIYHNGAIQPDGGSYSRSVCIDRLYYNPNGMMKRVLMTSEGVTPVRLEQSRIPAEKDMAAYLMVYFSDSDHSLHMALSSDGYTFTALNDNKPIIEGHKLASQKGIRDPHITRGPDGAFYVAMTDLHIFARREGYRETQWERDAEKYDWGNNRGFVLMKSFDLIHWTHSNVLLTEAFEELKNIGCAWAPQTIYDPEADKMMLYFTMRFGHGRTKLYYAYTDDDFTKLTTLPQLLFEYPNPEIQVLDEDITLLPDGRYCMMYVAQENPAGIKMAFSDHINREYVYQPEWIDFEPRSCEAPNVWKRIGENKWVLMVDIFSIQPHNFGFYETTDFVTFKDLGHFNEGVMKTTNFTSPKHGAVIHLTKQEAEHLAEHWNLEKY